MLVFADLPLETIVRSVPASVPWLPKAWRDSFLSWTAGGVVIEDDVTTALIEQGMKSHRRVLPGPERISEEQLRTLDLPVLVVLAGRSPMHDSVAAAEVARRNLPDLPGRLARDQRRITGPARRRRGVVPAAARLRP